MYKKKSPATLIYYSDKAIKKKLTQKRFSKARRERQLKLNFKGLAIVVIVLCFMGFLTSFVNFQKLLYISTVDVKGVNSFVNLTDVKKLAEEILLNENIFMINSKALTSTLDSNFLGAKSFTVKKKLPGRVEIEIIERVPYVIVKDRVGSLYYVDDEGFVLGNAAEKSTNLPQVLYQKDLKVGKFIDFADLTSYIELIKALDNENLSATKIELFPRYIYFTLTSNVEAYFMKTQNFVAQSRILSDLTKDLAAENRSPIKIDLRFDKVIVEFKESSESTDSSNLE
jgi:cell division septal protein FtsQ